MKKELNTAQETSTRRAITSEEYWGKVRAGMSEDELRCMREATRGIRTEAGYDSLRERFLLQGRYQVEAAALNGCHNAESIMKWYEKSFDAGHQLFGDEWITNPDLEPTKEDNMRLREQLIRLGKKFDTRHACHPSYEAFICYCGGSHSK